MKLQLASAKGQTVLIAFLIYLVVLCGWCWDGSRGAEIDQVVVARTCHGNNCSGNVSVESNWLSSTIRNEDDHGATISPSPPPIVLKSNKKFATSALTADPVKKISLGLLLPHTTFRVREYSKAVQSAMVSLRKQDLSFLNTYRFQVSDIHTDMLKVNPSPTGRCISTIQSQ